MRTLIDRLRRLAMFTAAGLLVFGFTVLPAAAQTTLTVYTALEAEELEPLRKAFRAEYPDIDIAWVRDSTGRRCSHCHPGAERRLRR